MKILIHKPAKILYPLILAVYGLICTDNTIVAQSSMTNITGRHCISLNGSWSVIIDPADAGEWRQVWKDKKPEQKTDFFEYSFDGGPRLAVPGDFNSQMPELKYYEGTIWYKKTFINPGISSQRLFLHFAAVNYIADVFLNGEKLGRHEGGFTPFQFEITGSVKTGENTIIVRVNNMRLKDGIPGLGFDWMNYGGITRDVNLVITASSFISDYFIQLKKHSLNEVLGWIKINGPITQQNINVKIPELDLSYRTRSDENGIAHLEFIADFELWSPANPKLYNVIVEAETDTISEKIGFRSIETQGKLILLNGKPVFLKGVNIHEENPLKPARAFSENDAELLLSQAKELGCNFVRLVHYPHNETMVRKAEEMGFLVWDEIPVYQHIEFESPGVTQKIDQMMREMIQRDHNRCGVFAWSLSNETYSDPGRDRTLSMMSETCRQIDSTRLITSVLSNQSYENSVINIWDSIVRYFDVIAINEYLGWYVPWPCNPEEVKWTLVSNDKPLIITEFGGEALYGNNTRPKDEASSWAEEYQEKIYIDQVKMFSVIHGLAGVCPWLLFDYRSPGRMHPVYQQGWNRKGLLSEKAEKKKAWYIMKNYYEEKINQY